jgi:antitoxin MazE
MQIIMHKMGNSHELLIPKQILNQLGLLGTMGKIDLQVNGNVIEIHAVKPAARVGWAQDSVRLAAAGDI